MERAVAVFAITFAVFYPLAFNYNLTRFTYYPAVNEFRWGPTPGTDTLGPPMFWYGWIVAGLALATSVGLAASLLSDGFLRGVWPFAAWAVPVGSMFYMTWAGRHWFTFRIENLPH